MAIASDDGTVHHGALADPRVRPDDGIAELRVFLDQRTSPEHGIGADLRALLHVHAGVDEARSFERRAVVDARLARHHRPRPIDRSAGEHAARKLAVEHVAVYLHVLLRRADVDPVAAIDVGDEAFAAFDQRWEVGAFDRVRHVLGNPIEGVGLEHVDAGVDRVAGDLIGTRLFEEPPDPAIRFAFDETVGGGVIDRRQHNRRLGLAFAMEADHGSQVDAGHDVAVEDHDGVGDALRGIADGAAGTERRRFDDVANTHAGAGAIAKDLLDAPRLVVETENDLVDFRKSPEEIDLIVQKGAIENRDDRLWCVECQRTQPRAFAPGEQNGLHDKLPSYTTER